MNYIELENKLKAHVKRCKMIQAALSLVFFIIMIVFIALYQNSRTVTTIGEGLFQYQSVTYNYDLSYGIAFGAMGGVISAIVLLCGFMFVKVKTFEISGDYVTFYLGYAHTRLYVNGVLKADVTTGYHVEATLSDESTVNAALGKWSMHITFTNGHPPIDM